MTTPPIDLPALVVDAEIVTPINKSDAERLDKRIRLLVGTINDNLTKLYELVEQGKAGDIHKALGYPSWTAYVADVFNVQVRLERQQRRELVAYLSGEGMPNTVISDVLNVDEKTVRNDRAAISENSDIEPSTVLRKNGRPYTRKPNPSEMTELDVAAMQALDSTRDHWTADELEQARQSDDPHAISGLAKTALARGLVAAGMYADVQEALDSFAMADLTDDEFDSVLAEARAQEDLSRENVAQICRERATDDDARASITGPDGKSYPAAQPKREPEPEPVTTDDDDYGDDDDYDDDDYDDEPPGAGSSTGSTCRCSCARSRRSATSTTGMAPSSTSTSTW